MNIEMNIENVKWIELSAATETDEVVYSGVKAKIDGQELFVPKDPSNRHWQAIIEWAKEDSNEIAAAD